MLRPRVVDSDGAKRCYVITLRKDEKRGKLGLLEGKRLGQYLRPENEETSSTVKEKKGIRN